LLKKIEPSTLVYYHGYNAYNNKKDRSKNVRLPTSKLALALFLSIAVHSLLFLSGEAPEPYLSQHSIIHARLDKQDQELIQQEQIGQITKQHNEQISQASNPSRAAKDQPIKQDASKASASKPDQVINSQSQNERKTIIESEEEAPESITEDVKIEELVEQTAVVATQPKTQQDSQINSDSRAQVEALKGTEDPTYTSYHKVLTQYLGQRLEAKAAYKGTVRLKIKLEYGSVATSIKVIESSGNIELDSWAKKAALAANPYPKIPKEIGSTFEFSPTLQFGTDINTTKPSP
jgi:TonB family protein